MKRWNEKPFDEYPMPDLNPYLQAHLSYGPPVLTAAQAQDAHGNWAGVFGREAPLHVEIGAGNGFFLSGMSAAHPDVDWVGLEIRFKRVIQTARKLQAAGVTNARIARYDVRHLVDLFEPASVTAFYLNHPDPWPKDRHAKNRLLQDWWLDELIALLLPGGELRLKTDHLINVEALLELLPGRPVSLLGRSDDVARDGAPWEGDVTTNYQSKFDQKGEPVYALRVRRD